MNEKASRKEEGEDTIPKTVTDLPGFPSGEELSLDPIEGDEIDPLPKWWDETIEADRSKVENRRLEDGIEPEMPRRKKLRALSAEDSEAEVPAPLETPLPDPVEAIAAAEAAEATETPTLVGMPEIDLGSIKVTHRPKSEPIPESLQDGDLSDFFAPDDATNGEPAPEITPTIDPTPEATGPDPEPIRKAGPPPIPVPLEEVFELGFETKQPLIPGSNPVVKPLPLAPPPPAPVETVVITPAPEVVAETPAPIEVVTPPVIPTLPILPPGPISLEVETPEFNPESKLADPVEEFKTEETLPVAPAAEELSLPEVEETVTPPAPAEVPAAPASTEPAPVIGDPLAAIFGAPVKKKAGCWTVFATLFFFATLLVVGLLVGAGFYAWSKMGQFEEEIATLAKTKLEEQGIHLDYGAWSYEFPRGLVFDEVTVYDDATKARPAIKATGLGVNVDLLALVKDSANLQSAEFSLSDSKVTLFEKGELFAEIEGVDGEILADASAITVERLSALVGGLRVRLDGVVSLSGDKATATDSPAAPAAPAADGARPSALPALDFSGFRVLQPWLGLESTGGEPPLLTLSFVMDSGEPDLATLEGTLGGSDVTWHGVAFSSLAADFRIDPKTGELRFPHVQAGYGSGLIGAVLAVDMASQTLKIERLQSTVDWVAMLSAYDPAWAETFKNVRMVDAPTVQLTGEMPLGEPVNADLKIRYEHRMGFVHLDGERELPLSDIRGLLSYQRGALETNDVAANLFGGQVFINGATNLVREGRPFTGLVEISGMPLEKAAVWFGQEGAGLSGRLFLTFRGTGNSGLASINGGGNLRIEEAALPKFPVIGPVQALIGRVIPAFASTASGSVAGAYIIESGILVTSDFTVRNGGARVVTNGSVNLAKMETTFVTIADLEPALASATGLKDKAIQVEGSGPLGTPALKITRFPVEFAASGLGEVLGTTPESLGVIKEVLGSDDATEVITGTIEEATGLELDPAVTDLLKGLMGDEAPAPAPAKPVLRAVPQN